MASVVDRFWSRVDKSGGPNACWIWTGTVSRGGYGQIRGEGGRRLQVHRLSCEIAHGPPTEAKPFALHSCGVRNCVQPLHLRWGNHQDNADDAQAMGSQRDSARRLFTDGHSINRGEAHGMARLDETAALDLYRRAWAGENQAVLAAAHGVSSVTVSNIKQGKLWGWLTGHPRPEPQRSPTTQRRKQPRAVIEDPLLDFTFDDRAVQRFHNRIDTSGGSHECWLWSGTTNAGNYGQVTWRGRTLQAHRVALALAGTFPPNPKLLALHGCNNPVCVNPAHLRWGTHKENAEDKIKAGRVRVPLLKGESHPNARLTERDVHEIVERLDRGDTNTDIARDYGVVHQTVSDIKRGRKWGWLTGRG